MPYTATAITRADGDWVADELDLAEVEDFDGLVDLVRESAGTPDVALLFLEEDDEYLSVVCAEADAADAVVFVSDARALETRTLAARLFVDTVVVEEPVAVDSEDDDEDDSGRPEVQPAGDAALLSALGVDADTLLALCAEEGALPADVTEAVCVRIGAGPALDAVRGG